MFDLLAIAIVRQLLLELGFAMQPEEPGGLVGPLGLWVTQAREDLGGLTPVQVLEQPNGKDLLRTCLATMVETQQSSPDITRES